MGIDPGIKTGYAILNLNGKMIACGCEKEASDKTIIKRISKHGIPVLIASDTSPASSFVQKIAARLNVKAFSPKESMTKLEKRTIGKNIDDPHIRDSYAAAVKAYRRFQNRLRQIESMNVEDKEELKRMIVSGHRIGDILSKRNRTKHLNIRNA